MFSEVSYRHFTPAPHPIGTFGTVIQQKSLAPNRDALFDLGASGPTAGFVVSVTVTAIGLRLSHMEPRHRRGPPDGGAGGRREELHSRRKAHSNLVTTRTEKSTKIRTFTKVKLLIAQEVRLLVFPL